MPLYVSSTVVLIIMRSKLYYTASGIITPIGGRPVHRLRQDCAPDGHLQCVTTPNAIYTRHVFKIRFGLKLPPIGCTVRERACAGPYMCSLANVCHFVAGRSLFYVKKDWITVCAAINNPASCEVRAVIRFLLARNNNAAEIHRQLCEVHGPNVMSESKVRQWCRLFKEGRTNVRDEERSGRPSVMAIVFWEWKGILLIDFLERGLTINADAYCETVRKLRRAIQNKRRGMLSSGIVLLHDNARPHSAARTAQLLQQFRWEVSDHPPYSPDLAPSDYNLFMHLKKWLASQSFEDKIDWRQTLPHGSNRWRRTSLTVE